MSAERLDPAHRNEPASRITAEIAPGPANQRDRQRETNRDVGQIMVLGDRPLGALFPGASCAGGGFRRSSRRADPEQQYAAGDAGRRRARCQGRPSRPGAGDGRRRMRNARRRAPCRARATCMRWLRVLPVGQAPGRWRQAPAGRDITMMGDEGIDDQNRHSWRTPEALKTAAFLLPTTEPGGPAEPPIRSAMVEKLAGKRDSAVENWRRRMLSAITHK